MLSALPSETDAHAKSIGSRVGAARFPALQACAMMLMWMALLPVIRAQTAPIAPARPAASAGKNPLQPQVKIPVVPLGYLPPGDLPAFYYYAMVELHFIDADHLMFAFNTPRLLNRDHNCPGSEAQRMVRAVVLQLPSGQVLKQADWELYDFGDFLWGLGDGRLLLRRCKQLETVAADLDPQPLVQAHGTVEDVSLSPDRSIVVVEEKVAPGPADKDSGGIPSVLDQETEAQHTNVNFIQLHPLRMIGHAEIPLPSSIPLMGNGILEVLTAPQDQWDVNMQVLHGTERKIGTIHSFCPPGIRAISNDIFMAMTCAKGDQKSFQGYNLQGSLLWQIPITQYQYYPRLISIPTGSHFAIESLRLKHPRAFLDPITKDDIDGEDIDIYDMLSGVRVATFQTTPAYTGGRNVDFSPDGQQMAVLHDGAIEIYSLNDLIKALPGMSH